MPFRAWAGRVGELGRFLQNSPTASSKRPSPLTPYQLRPRHPHHPPKMMRQVSRVAARSALVAQPRHSSSLQVTISGLNYVGTGMAFLLLGTSLA